MAIHLELDAGPGEVARRLPELVEALLKADPSTPHALAHAAREALEHLGHDHEPLAKAGEPGEGDWWAWPVCGALGDAARAAIARRHARIVSRLEDALGPGFAKAEPEPMAKAGWWLTADKIKAMREVILDEHLALAVELYGPDVLGAEDLERLRLAGVITEVDLANARELGLLGAAPEVGALIADDDGAALLTADEARDLAEALAADDPGPSPVTQPTPGPGGEGAGPPPPDAPPAPPPAAPPPKPSTPAQWAARAARMRGGQQIVGLGNKVAGDLTTIAIDSEGERAQELRHAVAEAVAQGLEEGDRLKGIKDRVVDALEGDYSRDIDRIVETETHAAMQQGHLDRLRDRHGGGLIVTVVPSPGACRTCMRLYTEGGTPKRFLARWLPPASVNFRRKAADREPCVPPLHPRCRCSIKRVPEGWVVKPDGQIVPPSMAKSQTPPPEPAPPAVRFVWGKHITR